MVENKRGITLIALVISIIVMLILAGVTINMLFGERGIILQTGLSARIYQLEEAKEKIMLKISENQMRSLMENGRYMTLQDLSNYLHEDNEIEYVTEKTNDGEASTILVKLKAYPFEFEIDEKMKLVGIDGAETTSSVETTPEEPQLVETDLSYFKFNDAGDTIIGVVDKNTLPSEIVIPKKNGDVTITGITTTPTTGLPYGGFMSCKNLTKVTIPNTVTQIGQYAFAYCENLSNINIPKNVTSMGADVFNSCKKLKTAGVGSEYNINYEEGITWMYLCDASYLETVVIPDTVTKIGNGAFYSCGNLKNITIPSSITQIGREAFGICQSLKNVVIPNTVTQIGEYAFTHCINLENINIPKSVSTMGANVFDSCKKLKTAGVGSEYNINYEEGITWMYLNGANYIETVVIPDTVTRINQGAFSSCTNLKNITIPSTITTVGNQAFYFCRSLKNITIPDSINNIGSGVFWGCDKLESIIIPNGITTIGTNTFYSCSVLKTITIPNTVTSIGESAFYSCSGLTDVTYLGEMSGWSSVTIGPNNTPLTNARMHYPNDTTANDTMVNAIESNPVIDSAKITGTQYIDTNYKANQNTKIEMEIESLGWTGLFMPFGGRGGSPNNCVGLWLKSTTSGWPENYVRFGDNSNYYEITLPSGYTSSRLNIILENGKLTIGDVEKQFPEAGDFVCNYNLYLGALNTAGETQNIGQSAKIYSCKIYNGTTLVREYVPVRNTVLNKVGLYDKVENKFYQSLGGALTE